MTVSAVTPQPRRWLALGAIGLAQLMVVMNSTVTSVAIPSIQRDLAIADFARAWIVTAYTLVFGGCLVLGGSIADRLGARRAFVLALAGFAVSATIAGTALTATQFFIGVGVQGLFAAVLVPAGVSKLNSTFTVPHERSRALGIYGSIAASGAAIGLLVGGVLTQYLSWRACCLMPLPFAALAIIAALTLLDPDRARGRRAINVAGAGLLTLGLASLVFGSSIAASNGLSSPGAWGALLGAAGLLVGFVVDQRCSRAPLIPGAVVRGWRKVTGLVAMALSAIGMQSAFLFVTLFEQDSLHRSPLATGLLFLPVPVVIALINTQVTARLLHRLPPQALIIPGLVCVFAGLLSLSALGDSEVYATGVLPTLLLVGAGQALIAFPVLTAILRGVAPNSTGLASAIQAAAQQTGGAIGLSVFNAIAVAIAGAAGITSVVGGVREAALGAAGLTLLVLVLIATFVLLSIHRGRRERAGSGDYDPGSLPAAIPAAGPAPIARRSPDLGDV